MNERIKELAVQAELVWSERDDWWVAYDESKDLERFAELVRQDEREACAKLCAQFQQNLGVYKAHEDSHDDGWQDACCEIQTAIKQRGEK
jgi:hypothetical protein